MSPVTSLLKEVRMKALLDQTELAKAAGIKPNVIWRAENGHLPRLDHALMIAKALNSKIEDIFLLPVASK